MVAGEGSEPSEPSFEQILSRLHQVVERLESGELPLEESLAIFEEGIRLSRLGAQRLDDAERRVEELLGDGETARAVGDPSSSQQSPPASPGARRDRRASSNE